MVNVFIPKFRQLAEKVGVCPLFAKSHELFHISHDLEWFGPGRDVSTGAVVVLLVLDTIFQVVSVQKRLKLSIRIRSACLGFWFVHLLILGET